MSRVEHSPSRADSFTPTDHLRGDGAVLALLDAFDPPAEAHRRWLLAARDALAARGRTVSGAILLPVATPGALLVERLRACEALTASDPWIALDAWPLWQRAAPTAREAFGHLRAAVRREVIPVFSERSFPKLAWSIERSAVVVATGDAGSALERFMAARGDVEVVVLRDLECPLPDGRTTARPPWEPLTTSQFLDAWSSIGLTEIAWSSLAFDTTETRRLGRGASAKVRAAHHPTLGPVAVKLVPMRSTSALREAWAFARLHVHGNDPRARHVVRCHGGGVDVDGERMFLVLERGDGTLDGHRAPDGETFPSPDVARWLYAVASGMSWLADAGLTHRDLRPGNVLRVGDAAKVLDLGLAWPPHDASPGPWDPGVPMRGEVRRQAPEVIVHAANYSAASDVFAFGTLLWELATGDAPWPERDPSDALDALVAGHRPSVNETRWNPAARELLDACWQQRPEHRPSFDEVTKALARMGASPLLVVTLAMR